MRGRHWKCFYSSESRQNCLFEIKPQSVVSILAKTYIRNAGLCLPVNMNDITNMYKHIFITFFVIYEFVMTLKVNPLHDTHLSQACRAGNMWCLCEGFLWFYCCCVFYSIRNCGKFWPSNRSMTLVISLSFICFSSLNKFQTKLMLSYIKSNKSIALTENQM